MGKDRKNSGQVSATEVIPVALEEWSVAPVSLDDWAVEPPQEAEPTTPSPKKKKASAASKITSDSELAIEALAEAPKKSNKKSASKGKKGSVKSSDEAVEAQDNSGSVESLVPEVKKKSQLEVSSTRSAKVLEVQPIAVAIDDWAEPEPVSLDAWGTEDSEEVVPDPIVKEESKSDQFVDVFETEQLDFESLDDYLESEHHPVLAENDGAEPHASLNDTPLPEDSFRAAEELYEDNTLSALTVTTESIKLDFNVDSESIQLDLSMTPAPKNNVELQDVNDSFDIDFDVPQEEFEGSPELDSDGSEGNAENFLGVKVSGPSITPTQTRTVEIKFLEQELLESIAPRDEDDQSNTALINHDEDLGLDIDDLNLPGTELETVANFNVSSEESFDFAVRDQDEEDGFFELRTVATMIQTSESLDGLEGEEESAAAEHFESYNKTKSLDVDQDVKEISSLVNTRSSVEPEQVDDLPSVVSTPSSEAPSFTVNNLYTAESDLSEPIILASSDLADQQVVVLTLADLRKNSHLAVLCLGERDLAVNHRIVFDLNESYFLDNDIQQNVHGVIILKASDLVHPELLEEIAPTKKEVSRAKVRKATKGVKKSFSDRLFPYLLSVKVNLWACVILVIAISIVYQFKYSWTTVSEERYQEVKFNSSPFGWYTSTMFKYRTPDSAWRWFGQQLLRPSDYEKVIEQSSSAWIYYDKSQQDDVGDSFE